MADTASEDHLSDLVDLSQLRLGDVLALDDSAIAHALRRLADEIDQPQGAVAGWQSAI